MSLILEQLDILSQIWELLEPELVVLYFLQTGLPTNTYEFVRYSSCLLMCLG